MRFLKLYPAQKPLKIRKNFNRQIYISIGFAGAFFGANRAILMHLDGGSFPRRYLFFIYICRNYF